MKILFLTQVLPYPLTGGARIRAYYVLRHLSQRHEVTLVSFVRPDDSVEDVAHLTSFCKAVHVVPMVRSRRKNVTSLAESLVRGRPAVIVRDRLPAMQTMLSELMGQEQFEAIHADQTSMAQYALYAQGAAVLDHSPPIVLDQHNALYLLVQRQAAYEHWLSRPMWRREARRLVSYERELCRHFDQILTVTDVDKRALLALFSAEEAAELSGKISPIPICIDASNQAMLRRPSGGKQIVHLGTMFWPPNIEGVVWFAEEVLPLIWRETPEARFVIAGKDPPREVMALSEDGNTGTGGIVVTGFVEDPAPLLEQSQVFVVPVRAGGGMRVKIVNAWLWGLPVVSTTIGAEGLIARPGENIMLADEPEDFASAVIQLLNNPDLAEGLRIAGRKWVEEQYDYRQVYGRIDRVYERIEQKYGAA